MRKNEPSVLDLAQLALDVYNDPAEDDIRKKYFNANWIAGPTNNHRGQKKFDRTAMANNEYPSYSCPKTGLYARIYYNKHSNYSVLAIRGTEGKYNDFATDAGYMLNYTELQQYEDAKEFFYEMKKYLQKTKPMRYVCGHSLGGILAKMIAPNTHLPTCAFNSPGVLDFLLSVQAKKMESEKLPFNKDDIVINLGPKQVVVTFIANKDMIGETNHQMDLGSRFYLATRPSNSHSINEYKNSKELEHILKDKNSLTSKYPRFDDPFTVHSMVDFFKYFYINGYENVYLEKFKPFHKHHERYDCYRTINSLVNLNRYARLRDYHFFNQEKELQEKKKKYCTIYDEHKENFEHYLADPLTDYLRKNPIKMESLLLHLDHDFVPY